MKRTLRALRVTETATSLLESKKIARLPLWHDIISTFPPSETLSRPLMNANVKRGKSSRMYKPMQISYKEDELRTEFFGDHPWELARPRMVLEGDGKSAKGWDWSKIEQRGKKLDGESVVLRQLWLMENNGMSKAAAYDKARQEFYRIRHLEEVERRVAKEEALSTGAYFGRSTLDIGMQLENEMFENWKAWARKEIVFVNASRSGVSRSLPDDEQPEEEEETPEEAQPRTQPS